MCHLPSIHTNPTHTIRIAQTPGTAALTMGYDINGLHHSTADKQWERCVVGDNRPANQNGTLCHMPQHHEPRRPDRPLPPASDQTPQTIQQHCIRQRVPIHRRLLETRHESTRDITQPPCSLLPVNGRTNGKGQCHPGAVSLGILQLSTGRLGKTTTNCRILLQQHPNRNHNNNPLLRQL